MSTKWLQFANAFTVTLHSRNKMKTRILQNVVFIDQSSSISKHRWSWNSTKFVDDRWQVDEISLSKWKAFRIRVEICSSPYFYFWSSKLIEDNNDVGVIFFIMKVEVINIFWLEWHLGTSYLVHFLSYLILNLSAKSCLVYFVRLSSRSSQVLL